jgi:hypothetical protein
MTNPWKDALTAPVTLTEIGAAIDTNRLSISDTVAHVLNARVRAARVEEERVPMSTRTIPKADAERGFVPFQWRRVEEYNLEPFRWVLALRSDGIVLYSKVYLPSDALAWAEIPAPPSWAMVVQVPCDAVAEPVMATQETAEAAVIRRMDALERQADALRVTTRCLVHGVFKHEERMYHFKTLDLAFSKEPGR